MEGLTKFYGVPILVSEATMSLCPDIYFREVDSVRVKGKKNAQTIFEPLGLKAGITELESSVLEQFKTALAHYKEQQWQQATDSFNSLAERSPEELLYRLYLDRVSELHKQPPGADWDGVYTHTQK